MVKESIGLQRLKSIQEELQREFNLYKDKVSVIKNKYNEQRKSHYNKRSDLIKIYPNFWHTVVIVNCICNVDVYVFIEILFFVG
jgi:hypothetical protein